MSVFKLKSCSQVPGASRASCLQGVRPASSVLRPLVQRTACVLASSVLRIASLRLYRWTSSVLRSSPALRSSSSPTSSPGSSGVQVQVPRFGVPCSSFKSCVQMRAQGLRPSSCVSRIAYRTLRIAYCVLRLCVQRIASLHLYRVLCSKPASKSKSESS